MKIIVRTLAGFEEILSEEIFQITNIKPEVGTLIMFPSWLRHGVMPFFSDVPNDERRTFSANINITLKERLTGDHYRKDRA